MSSMHMRTRRSTSWAVYAAPFLLLLSAIGPAESLGAASNPASLGCVGDCDRNGVVTVDELQAGMSILLGEAPLARCPSLDVQGDGIVTVDELVDSVNNALGGCPSSGSYFAAVPLANGQSGIVNLEVQADGQASGTLRITDAGGAAAYGLSGSGAAVIATIPLLGTVDLGAWGFSLTGMYNDVAVSVTGTLPGFAGGSGTLTVQIGADVYSTSIVVGNGTPTPTRTATTTATATPTPTGTRTGTFTATPTATVPPATPTLAVVPPGIYAVMLGTWTGPAANETTHVEKTARIKLEVRSNKIYAVDLNKNVFVAGDIPMSVTAGAPQVVISNRVVAGNKVEILQLSLVPFTGGLAGTYSTTTMSFPPTVDALGLDLHKE